MLAVGRMRETRTLRGSISADHKDGCPKCGGKFVHISTPLFPVAIPQCEKCSSPPKRCRIDIYLPKSMQPKRCKQTIRYTIEGERLDNISKAVMTLERVNREIQKGQVDLALNLFRDQKTLTFDYLSKMYIEQAARRVELQDLTPAAFKEKERLHRIMLRPHFGRYAVFEITYEQMVEFLTLESKRKRSSNLAIQELKAFMRVMKRQGYLRHLPEFPKISQANFRPEERIISKDLQDKILALIEPRLIECLFRVKATFALRMCEVRVLKVLDYDPESKEITIQRHLSKGTARHGEVILEGRKSQKGGEDLSRLTFPVPSHLVGILEELTFGRDKEDFMFPGKLSAFVSEAVAHRAWKKACKILGVNVTPYEGNRHATLSHLISKGKTLEQVRRLSGHTNTQTVQRYARARKEDLKELLKKEDGPKEN